MIFRVSLGGKSKVDKLGDRLVNCIINLAKVSKVNFNASWMSEKLLVSALRIRTGNSIPSSYNCSKARQYGWIILND